MDELEALRHRPLVFVDDMDRPRLSEADDHHFRRVLRVESGAAITIGDGSGAWQEARFGPRPEPVGPIGRAATPSPELTVAFAPVKGTRAEWVVQKLTELGIDHIALVETERSVVRWDAAKRRKQLERLRGAAREACLQARRLVVPTVAELEPLDRFLDQHPGARLADPAGVGPTADDTVIVVGPEGGFSPEERAGRPAVRLPGHILRAETAAVTAAGMVTAIRSRLL